MDFGHSHLGHHTPGHTPSDLTFKIGDALFVGDSPFYHGTGEQIFPEAWAGKCLNRFVSCIEPK